MKWTQTNLLCPKCNGLIRTGYRYFGPSLIVCGHCNETINSGLKTWRELGIGRRIFITFAELIWPSWMGINKLDGIVIRLLLELTLFVTFGLALWGIYCGISYGLGAVFGNVNFANETNIEFLGYSMFFSFPIFHLVRLIRMIIESNTFSMNRVPPLWKSGPSRKKMAGK
jgi:hypothetical protein